METSRSMTHRQRIRLTIKKVAVFRPLRILPVLHLYSLIRASFPANRFKLQICDQMIRTLFPIFSQDNYYLYNQ